MRSDNPLIERLEDNAELAAEEAAQIREDTYEEQALTQPLPADGSTSNGQI